jgi:hypothetical protein
LHGRVGRRCGLRLVQHIERHRQELVAGVGEPGHDGLRIAGGRDD